MKENKISTKKAKVPVALRAIAWLFPKVEKIAPFLAKRWGVRLFFTPLRYPVPRKEQSMADRAEQSTLVCNGRKIQVYSWGTGDRIIIGVHGWSGRGTQFYRFAPLLIEAGYRLVVFDGPAHHRSQGKQTSILEFADVLVALEETYGKAEALLSHSFGGIVCLYVLRERLLNTKKLISICTPSVGDEIVTDFLDKINGSLKIADYLYHHIKEKFGVSFAETSAEHLIKDIPDIDYLIVHDINDKEVPLRHGQVLSEAYPKAILHTPSSMGHTRVLRDEAVVARCTQFITKEKTTFSTAN